MYNAVSYSRNRFIFGMLMFSYRSQMVSNCGNKKMVDGASRALGSVIEATYFWDC